MDPFWKIQDIYINNQAIYQIFLQGKTAFDNMYIYYIIIINSFQLAIFLCILQYKGV